MVLPQGIHEERFHNLLPPVLYGIYGIHQVGVVHYHLGGFLGKLLPYGIYDIDESCIGQILYVVHHGGTAGLYFLREVAYVRGFRALHGQQVEEFFYFSEILQFYLFDKQYVYLRHHVHRLQQILVEVAVLKEKRVETMMQILLEVFGWAYNRQDVLDYLFMMREYVIE